MPSYLGRPWNNCRHGVAIAAYCQIDASKDAGHFDRVYFCEGSFQERLRNLKADKVMVGLRRIVTLGDLVDIESKLYLRVRRGLFLIGDDWAEFFCQLGVHKRNCAIGREGGT